MQMRAAPAGLPGPTAPSCIQEHGKPTEVFTASRKLVLRHKESSLLAGNQRKSTGASFATSSFVMQAAYTLLQAILHSLLLERSVETRGEILSLGHDLQLMAKRHNTLKEAGYNVVSAVNPHDALKLLNARKFDVLVVGCIEEREIRRMEEAAIKRGTPVLSLCCQPPDGGRMSCQDAVIMPAELVARVNALCPPRKEQQSGRAAFPQIIAE